MSKTVAAERFLMPRRVLPVLGTIGLSLLLLFGWSYAQRGTIAPRGVQWIWTDEGEPLKQAPTGLRFFRALFEVDRDPAEVKLYLVCDDAFVAYVNGVRVGSSRSWQSGSVFDITDKVRIGRNALAVEATNRGGPAGLAGWVFVRTKPGNHYVYPTNQSWRWATEPSEGWMMPEFPHDRWRPVKVLGAFGTVGPWGEIGFGTEGRFRALEGFHVEMVADPELTGSIIAFGFDTQGLPLLSVERGPIIRLHDDDGDGVYERKSVVCDQVSYCQGLLAYDPKTYYFVGMQQQGKKVVTGLWRGLDEDEDGKVDKVELLHQVRGRIAEHGPHAILVGPDGYLYFVTGNHAWVNLDPPAHSPVRMLYEGVLLPRYEDAHGHARGIRVPGGTIWRLDPDARDWTLETAGFRNEYDIGFNRVGEVFTFDSDMEWDEGLPWYRPVRVNHCPSGAEFGWRSGCAKWPPYYVDSLPATVDIGRGSPTGVVFYHHTVYPARFHDAFFIADWSYGRIFAVSFKRQGASYSGEAELFLLGKPLNVTDLDVGPDGFLYFTTGGRGTEGGLYRVVYGEAGSAGPPLADLEGEEAVLAALQQPQPWSAWGRERVRKLKAAAGDAWQRVLNRVILDEEEGTGTRVLALSYLLQFGPEPDMKLTRRLMRSSDRELRAWAAVLIARLGPKDAEKLLGELLQDSEPIVQRRAIEGFLRLTRPVPKPLLRPVLASTDRFLRFAGLLALERTDPESWADWLDEQDRRVAIMAVVALNRGGAVARSDHWTNQAFSTCWRLLQTTTGADDELEVLRGIQLSLINSEKRTRPEQLVEQIAEEILRRFPSGDWRVNREYARLLAYLEPDGTVEKLVEALESCGTVDQADRAQAIHYARCLVACEKGWTGQLRRRYLKWFDVSADWDGGHSYRGYLMNFLRDFLRRVPEEEKLALVADAAQYRLAALEIVRRLDQNNGAAYVPLLDEALREGTLPREDVLLALGRVRQPEAERIVLHWYRSHPEDRPAALIALANYAKQAYREIFLQGLKHDDPRVVRAALQGLRRCQPEGPDDYRAVLETALRLGQPVGMAAVHTLRRWTGKDFGAKPEQWRNELDQFLAWYRETYPNAAPVGGSGKYREWTLEELLEAVEQHIGSADPERGKLVFMKASCVNCHKVGSFGKGIGPDLSTLGNRFSRKDILEAILTPSKTISDQYKTYTILTTRGQIINGMRAPDEDGKIVLLLSDATTVRIPKDEVEEIVESSVSIMPDGLLNTLSAQEIADLVAFLEAAQVETASGSR